MTIIIVVALLILWRPFAIVIGLSAFLFCRFAFGAVRAVRWLAGN